MNWFLLLLVIFTASSVARPSSGPDGAVVFRHSCATCHRPDSGTRAPLPAVLRQMTRESILRALETGDMRAQGALLTPDEREAVAKYLGKASSGSVSAGHGLCATPTPWLEKDAAWNGWGPGAQNTRFQSAAAAGLSRRSVPRLKLKWAFGFPHGSSINSSPAVFAGHVFVGTEDGTVYSLSAESGCINWTFKAPATVRTAPVVDAADRLVFFGDVDGRVYAVAAETGKLVWQRRADSHPAARIRGTPTLAGGRLYVPVSSSEEGLADNPRYPCCTFSGAITAFEARTGRKIWEAHTIPVKARRTGVNRAGVPTWGPSGASVWSPPTVDLKRHAIYAGTGNSYSGPPSPFTDAVIAFDMNTGKRLWSRQFLPRDLWNGACGAKDDTNCPPQPGPDYDFGSPPMLCSTGKGRNLLIIGQKSGVVYALDPDHKGRVVWQTRIGHGGPLGGIEFGGGADQNLIYFPLSDWQQSKPYEGGGLFALRIPDGQKVWYAPPPKPACAKLPGCSAALIAPVTVIPGVVFSGSQDGHLRAYNTRDGSLLWDFDTLRNFKTVNGVPGRGGAFSSIGAAVANAMLFIDPGYGGLPGNVLLAFLVDGK